ncbi:MAG: YfhO family protein [Atopobiaceae bacterium]|nr:YfhO family protein [Atopobiaceae bacterium]
MKHNAKRTIKRWEARAVALGCYRAYSALFVPFALLALGALPLNGREAMWYVDGLSQYFPFFLYEGQWLRGIASNLFAGRGLQVPLWEWCMGYGVDVPTTFDVFLDPLNLVSAVTPEVLSEWVFSLLVVLRLYLAGLAFAFYCRTRGESKTGTVLGALLYALCGAGLTGVRWASGLHALMLFPVVLAGAERILAGKRPWVFVASLTALAIMSYYFTYMAAILLVGYLALRVVMIERPNLTARRFFAWVARFAGLSALCALLAGFALVPAVCALMGMDRLVDVRANVPVLYNPGYYLRLATQFLSTFEVGSDTYQGFGGMAFFACVLLFVRKQRKDLELRIVFIVLSVFLLLPFVGSFFNAMNYASNRWAWAYAMCVAFVLVRKTPELRVLGVREERTLAVAAALYALLLVVPGCRTEANVAGYAALLGALLVVVLLFSSEVRRSALACGLALTLCANGLYYLSPGEGGIGSQQVPLGAAYPMLTSKSADQLAAEIDDPTWWRYDAEQAGAAALAPVGRVRNNSLVLGEKSISFYNSVYNDRIDAFHTELAVAGDSINFSYSDLQGRSDLMALLGVRYYLLRNDGTDAAPYDFDAGAPVLERPVAGIDYEVLRSEDALPLGVAFDKTLSRKEYLGLSPVERQQALLQAVVLNDVGTARTTAGAGTDGAAPTAGATKVVSDELAFESTSAPWSVASATDVVLEDGRFVASRAGATITLAVEGTAKADTYLYLAGLAYEPMPPSAFVSEEDRATMAWFSRINLMLRDLSYVRPMTYELVAHSDASAMSAFIGNSTPESHMFGEKDTWLASLGYAEKPVQSVTITFPHAGAYRFKDVQIITQTHERRAEWISQRNASALQNLEVGCNRLTGTIDLDSPQTLLLTMAYGAGWSAWVDGAPCEILPADTGFMALELAAGHHDVELRYQTPGLVAGFAVSAVGLVALVVLAFVMRRVKSGKL